MLSGACSQERSDSPWFKDLDSQI
jgi:hypothetical protein